jgi:hypothetical protein
MSVGSETVKVYNLGTGNGEVSRIFVFIYFVHSVALDCLVIAKEYVNR